MTALLPDTDHFNGREGGRAPVSTDGSPNAPAGLLRYLVGVLGLDEVMVHDLVAYAAAVTGHGAFPERFADEILTPKSGCRGWTRAAVFLFRWVRWSGRSRRGSRR